MIDPNRLFKAQFSKDLTSDSTEQAIRLLKLPKGKKPVQSERDIYVHQVLDSFSELEAIRENLNMAEILMNSYTTSKRWKDRYDQNHYFTYHYEAWIINAIRFYERLLILINSVFWLEINHKDISFKEVNGHKKLKGTDTLKVLNKVHGAFSGLQGVKNSVFHRYKYADDELDEISRFNFLARNSEAKEAEQFKWAARFKMKYVYLPKKRKEIHSNNEQIMKAAEAIFDTLEKPYRQQRDAFRS